MVLDDVDDDFTREFARRFAETWRTSNVDMFEELWSDDIVLIQPMMPTVRGKRSCRAAFEQLFALVPDLHADVHSVGHGDKEVFIEFTLSGTYGAKPIAWQAVDRITFSGGLIAERVSYFDATPLMLTLLRRPRGWGRLLRSGKFMLRR